MESSNAAKFNGHKQVNHKKFEKWTIPAIRTQYYLLKLTIEVIYFDKTKIDVFAIQYYKV